MADPMRFDFQKVLVNVRQSSTEDLLNRATVFREGMEPEAVTLIERELESRGIGRQEIEEYGAKLRHEVIWERDGTAARCSFCCQPAVAQAWGWHRLWGRMPLFPRFLCYCKEHRPAGGRP